MALHKVADAGELDEGAVKAVQVNGRPLAVTCFEGRIGVLDGRCPHAGGPLGEGEIDFGVLICPWHGREFHPTTGQCQGYAEHVTAYPVQVRDDGVYVQLPD